MFWNVRAMPRSRLSGRSPLTPRPCQRMSPDWGMYTWPMVLKIELLRVSGADDGKQLTVIDLEGDTVDRHHPPEARLDGWRRQ